MAPTLRWISVALLAAGGVLSWSDLPAENVYRYVDENGDVHFSATLPPEYADKPYEIISSSGLVIQRHDPMDMTVPVEQSAPEESASRLTDDEVLLRSDNLLVLKYHSEADIIDAMEVEVANLGYDALLLTKERDSLIRSLAAQVKEAADRQRAGMPPDEDTTRKLRELQHRLLQGAQAKDTLRIREEQIRGVFMAELERYRYLRSGGAPGSLPEG